MRIMKSISCPQCSHRLEVNVAPMDWPVTQYMHERPLTARRPWPCENCGNTMELVVPVKRL